MHAQWPIRKKLIVGVVLLLVTLAILSFSSFRGVYSYRGLVKGISHRGGELPLATELAQRVSDLRRTIESVRQMTQARPDMAPDVVRPYDPLALRGDFRYDLQRVKDKLDEYQERLSTNQQFELIDPTIYDNQEELETVENIRQGLNKIDVLAEGQDWILDKVNVDEISNELGRIHDLSAGLPGFLQERMQALANDVRLRYRTWIILTWVTTACALLLLILLVRLFYGWVFRPLKILIVDSQRVAGGDFKHRIRLPSQDEMADLANAMNNMTSRFQEIHAELDEKVRQRTKEVLRSDQLASVGFLAAGVAHEINNPLASIAICAESLEDRLDDMIQADDELPDSEHNAEIGIVRNYLRMMQDEAFRCKEITERLLDFSRLGDVEMQNTDLDELVQGVISMVGHIGKYKQKHIEYQAKEPVTAAVNTQEMKQVVLNLLTNALDSLDSGGIVKVELRPTDNGKVQLCITDDGCGMSPEVLEHLFEPFYTRRRDGQGTGLGLSISFRIIEEHGGEIQAFSDGPGTGSRFVVTLPMKQADRKETDHRHQAA